jgi:hypothetical protein
MDGRRIRFGTSTETYLVAFVDATHLQLDRPLLGDTLADATYKLYAWRFTLTEQAHAVESIGTSTGVALEAKRRWEIDEVDPARNREAATPVWWAWADEAEGSPDSPASRHQIEVWPLPTDEHSLLYTFRENEPGITDDSLDLAPLAWVSPHAIISRAKAHVLTNHPAMRDGSPRPGNIQVFMAEFESFLSDTALREAQRAGSSKVRVARRFNNPLAGLR